MTVKRMFLYGIVLAFAIHVNAKTFFHTERLKAIAEAVDLHFPDSLEQEAMIDSFAVYKGKVLKVKTNIWGDVSHIGYNLFDETAGAYGTMTSFLNFIERYFLELDLQIGGRKPAERIYLDKVKCSCGDIEMRHKVTVQTEFGIKHIERREYRIYWLLGKDTLELVVPADCQLIMGANAIELETSFEPDIERVVSTPYVCDKFDEGIVSSEDEYMVINAGDYLSDEIRSDLYLGKKGGKMELLLDESKPIESIKNILLTGCFPKDLPLALTINRYGYQKSEKSIILQQFVEYCRMEGCRMYVGIKSHTESMVSATVFALNNELGYNHVLSVEFPVNILSGKQMVITATSYMYIPLQNVSEDFFIQEMKESQL